MLTHCLYCSPTRRYHYNVSNQRLDIHVQKGYDDGLYISSVAACGELWGIIMDAGTGFNQQVRGQGGVGGTLNFSFVEANGVRF